MFAQPTQVGVHHGDIVAGVRSRRAWEIVRRAMIGVWTPSLKRLSLQGG
jgi:hypothetical protein